ncbi:MAG: NAD(P)-dependent oxidoreductase [Longimicrobiales bacterium]
MGTKIVLIGCGQIGMAAHLPTLDKLRKEGLLEIAAVCDADLSKAEAAARQFGVATFGADWRPLAKDTDANAVSVCLPPGPNAQVSAQALEAGLHVICEKPPGRNVVQAERMASAASSRPDLVHMIAFNRRFAPLYVKAMSNSRSLGEPAAFFGRFTRNALGADPSNTLNDWITSDGSHALDLAIATIGFPRCAAIARQRAGVGADNVWTIQLISERGSAIILFGFAAGRRVERFEWVGPGYDVLLELPERGEWAQQGAALQNWTAAELTQTEDVDVNYGFLGEYRWFIDAIVGRGPRPEADFIYGASFMRLVQTILESASGQLCPVTQPERTTPVSKSIQPKLSAPAIHLENERPVVQVMQSAAAQQKYFSVERLSQVAEQCDLRLRTEDNGAMPDISNAHALVLGWGAPSVAPEQIALARRLKLVVVLGASPNWALQPEALFERDILLCNTADAIAQSVAEHCLMFTLAGLRRLTDVDRRMRQGLWPPQSSRFLAARILIKYARRVPLIETLKPAIKPMAQRILHKAGSSNGHSSWNDLRGQIVGLIGWGHISKHFAELLQPFGCKLLVCSECGVPDELQSFNAQKASLGEVLGASKVISLHKGLTDRTKGMLDEQKLALIRPGTVLVNTARAGLIDEAALVNRARKGDIVIALDVFHQEPLPAKHPLRRLENVILSPHSGSSTPQCNRRVGAQALDILIDWAAGKPIPALDAARLATMS